MASYLWPLSNSATPDEMNTSFGPRINEDRWDFHDGIDLPAPGGTRGARDAEGQGPHAGTGRIGRLFIAPCRGQGERPGPRADLYNVYLHLDSIDPAVVTGGSVVQGQLIGTVGDDDATYTHLHMEFRKGTPRQSAASIR